MSEQDGAGRNVLAVPEFGTIRTLRPFDTFLTVYEGQQVGRPLMMTEGGKPKDEMAERGVPSYDPNLVWAMPVNIGQRLVISFPSLFVNQLDGPPYLWLVAWRYRNIFDHRIGSDESRRPYHLPKQGLGVADATGPNPGPRVPVPAKWQSIIYNPTEPTGVGLHARSRIRAEDIFAGASKYQAPLMPDGSAGVIQQGILPSTEAAYTQPSFLDYEIQAVGDELLIGLTRDIGEHPTWEFADYDLRVAEFFDPATPDRGVYVTPGVSP